MDNANLSRILTALTSAAPAPSAAPAAPAALAPSLAPAAPAASVVPAAPAAPAALAPSVAPAAQKRAVFTQATSLPIEQKLKMKLNQYGCWSCSRSGCRLWRYWDVRSSELKCANCMPHSSIDLIIEEMNRGNDLIDQMYPAIPYPHGNSYYEYIYIPVHLQKWWYSLPI